MKDIRKTAVDRLLSIWEQEKTIAENVVQWHDEAAREAELSNIPTDIHPALVDALQNLNIHQLYSHQVESWNSVKAGSNVVIVTGTASGKTLCYQLPILDAVLSDQKSTALFFFPTKALAQDQFQSLSTVYRQAEASTFFPRQGSTAEIPIAVYDGDTPSSSRSAIRTKSRMVMTNPDMIHLGILPHHTLWSDFFRNLKFVVIDEIHIYRGVFGSHVANVIRRIKRVAGFYGAHPQFILTSATIANPSELASRLIEDEVHEIQRDGSPHGAKHFLLYNPPFVQPELGIRRSASAESLRLTEDLLSYGVQTLIFTRTRRSVEILLKYLQDRQSESQDQLHGYRSGYLPKERREIERGLRDGSTRVVVSTNALELGVDIGSAGAVIMVGYPGTIAATRQQSGRAGRRSGSSLAVMVASAAPLDQFIVQHPEFLFDRSPEQALINPDNLLILLQHIRCAAFELPFRTGEAFGLLSQPTLEEILELLTEAGLLHKTGNRYFWTADQYPANDISLRTASGETILLILRGDGEPKTIGLVDQVSAHWMVHPDAIYIHEGASYQVDELSLDEKKAYLSPAQVDFFTEPRNEVTLEKINTIEESPATGCNLAYGEILVTTQVIGYRKIAWLTREVLSTHNLLMPATQLRTIGYWVSLDDATVEKIREEGLWTNDPNEYGPNWNETRNLVRKRDQYTCQVCGAVENEKSFHVHHIIPFRQFTNVQQANKPGNLITLCPNCHQKAEATVYIRSGLAGVSYVLHQLAPLFLMCDVGDLGAHSDPQSPFSDMHPTIVIYDLLPAGIGLSEALYKGHTELIQQAYHLVINCPCKDGCPSCVGPTAENGSGGKKEALAILALLNGLAIPDIMG
jgi:DEAD/DEAH box helicase domain-containing protein